MGASDPEVAPWLRCGARGMVGASPGARGAELGAPPGDGVWGLQPPRPPQSSSRGVEAAAVAGLGTGDSSAATEALFLALGAGVTALSHPLFYVKLLIQVGHEPLPPTVGTNVLGRKVFYLPNFFTYGRILYGRQHPAQFMRNKQIQRKDTKNWKLLSPHSLINRVYCKY